MERIGVVGCAPLQPTFPGISQTVRCQVEEAPHLAFLFDARQHQLLVIARRFSAGTLMSGMTRNRHPIWQLSRQPWRDFLNSEQVGMVVANPAGFSRFGQLPSFVRSLARLGIRHPLRSQPTRAPVPTQETVLKNDVMVECERRGLPRPRNYDPGMECRTENRPARQARLKFKDAIEGPIILRKKSASWGGVFASPGWRTLQGFLATLRTSKWRLQPWLPRQNLAEIGGDSFPVGPQAGKLLLAHIAEARPTPAVDGFRDPRRFPVSR